MFVKPAPGLKVRDPISHLHLPDAGREVPEDSHWLRQLAAGDVVPATLDPVPAAPTKE